MKNKLCNHVIGANDTSGLCLKCSENVCSIINPSELQSQAQSVKPTKEDIESFDKSMFSFDSPQSVEREEITCPDCWGSSWEVQFVKPCERCNGTGKVHPTSEVKEVSAEEILKSKLSTETILLNNSDYTFHKVIEAMEEYHTIRMKDELTNYVMDKGKEITRCCKTCDYLGINNNVCKDCNITERNMWKPNSSFKNIIESISEKDVLGKMHEMCIESLSPEHFTNWERIKRFLISVRKNLK